MKICFLTVFYNTRDLFYPFVKSIEKQSGLQDYIIEIYENSTNDSLALQSNLTTDKIKITYVDKSLYTDIPKNNGSAHHTKTIDFALNSIMNKYDFCVLLDSDVLITRNITDILSKTLLENYTLAGYHDITSNRNLIHPCAMIINLKHIQAKNIKFFDSNRMWYMNNVKATYDTGMSFYEDVIKNNLTVLELPYNYFANHFGAGSRNYKTAGKVQTKEKIYRDLQEWLTDFAWTYHDK